MIKWCLIVCSGFSVAAKVLRIAREGTISLERAGLIATQPNRLVDGVGMLVMEFEVVFDMDHKERRVTGEPMQTFVIDVPAVHDAERAGYGRQGIERIDIVRFSQRNMDERGDVVAQIQQRAQLDSGLNATLSD